MKFKKSINQHGIGLGLFNCKTITDSLGGTIRCSSIKGQGTTFKVDTPIEIIDNQRSQIFNEVELDDAIIASNSQVFE